MLLMYFEYGNGWIQLFFTFKNIQNSTVSIRMGLESPEAPGVSGEFLPSKSATWHICTGRNSFYHLLEVPVILIPN